MGYVIKRRACAAALRFTIHTIDGNGGEVGRVPIVVIFPLGQVHLDTVFLVLLRFRYGCCCTYYSFGNTNINADSQQLA
jgi:hypothetical protein